VPTAERIQETAVGTVSAGEGQLFQSAEGVNRGSQAMTSKPGAPIDGGGKAGRCFRIRVSSRYSICRRSAGRFGERAWVFIRGVTRPYLFARRARGKKRRAGDSNGRSKVKGALLKRKERDVGSSVTAFESVGKIVER